MMLDTYQRLSMRTAKTVSKEYDLVHASLGVAGEAGEFVDAIKKHAIYGKPLDVDNASEEIGDLLWYMALACNALGLSFGLVAKQNIEKLKKRYPEMYSDELASTRLDKQGETQ